MCDEQVSSLQNTLQSLGSKVPKIILRTLEKIYPAPMGNMQNIDTIKAENDVDVEEDFIGMKMDEIYIPSAFSIKMTEPENCLDLLKAEPGSYSETCVTPSHDGNQVVGMNIEEVTNVQQDEDPLLSPVIKVEHENCMDLLKVEPGSYKGTCITSSHDGSQIFSRNVEEVTNVQEEDPLLISRPVIKAEHEQNMDTIKVENDEDIKSEEDSIVIKTDEGYIPSAFSVKVAGSENCTDLLKVVPDPCVAYSHDGSQVINIKVEEKIELVSSSNTCPTTFCDGSRVIDMNFEEITNIQEEEDPLLLTFPATKTEHTSTLAEHQVIHDEECLYARDICHKSFTIQFAQKGHCCLYCRECLYSCDACKKSFDTQSNLKAHQCICSEGNPLACGLYTKALREDSNVNQHQCLQSGERPNDGVHNASVSNKSDIDRHQHPRSSKGPYSCYVCDKTFSKRDHLIQHQCIHSGERPYSCNVCKKSFSNKSNLKQHQRIHTGERLYSCDVCNKSFGYKSNLNQHRRLHNGERPFSCDICKKSFSNKSNLKQHQQIHTRERSYACDVCNKSFGDKSNLNQHQRLHSGERPFSCDVCNKSFSYKTNLKQHRRIHSGERPYFCDVCNKSFSYKNVLKIHQATHSREGQFF